MAIPTRWKPITSPIAYISEDLGLRFRGTRCGGHGTAAFRVVLLGAQA